MERHLPIYVSEGGMEVVNMEGVAELKEVAGEELQSG